MITLFFVTVILTFFAGLFCGFLLGKIKKLDIDKSNRQKIYCAGWRDSIYTALGEHDPKYYFEKKAIESFKEYECVHSKNEFN